MTVRADLRVSLAGGHQGIEVIVTHSKSRGSVVIIVQHLDLITCFNVHDAF